MQAPTPLVLVLEDDCLVAPNLLHSILSWRWPWHPEFGAGFLYNPGGYASTDCWYEGRPGWYGTVAVLFRTADLPSYVESSLKHFPRPWDVALTRSLHRLGRRIRVHYPALVEHPDDVPSAVGNRQGSTPMRTSNGTYQPGFVRDRGHPEHVLRNGQLNPAQAGAEPPEVVLAELQRMEARYASATAAPSAAPDARATAAETPSGGCDAARCRA